MTRASEPTDLLSLIDRLGELWLTYVKGQLLLSLIVGALTWVVNAGVGLSWALGLGVVAGILETVPSIGPILATIPAVVVALWKGSSTIPVENWIFALIVIGIYVAISQIGALYLEPRILGKRLNLPPLVVFVGVILGALVGGVIGAYLAVPLIASLREVLSFVRGRPGSASVPGS